MYPNNIYVFIIIIMRGVFSRNYFQMSPKTIVRLS